MRINHGVLTFFVRLEKKQNLLYRKGMLQYRGDVCRISTVSMKIRNRLITWTLYMGLGK